MNPILQRSTSRRGQHGQAMSEFIAACAVLVPLFIGIVYLGKYSDMKASAIQASRYAAFERAFDPNAAHKSTVVLADETRARFFTDGSRAGGKLAMGDSSSAIKADEAVVALWRDMQGNRLIDKRSTITVNIDDKPIAGAFEKLINAEGKIFKLNDKGLYYSNVEVSVANVKHFEPLKSIDLKLGATTALLGDVWSAAGSVDVAKKASRAVPSSYIPKIPGADFLFDILVDSPAPQFGCVSADVVPKDRLETYKPVGYCKN